MKALTAYWGYVGLPPSELPFFDYAQMFVVYTEYKAFHVKGCSQAMSSAIADTITANGGEIRYSTGVSRILVEDGKVQGVVTEHGEEIATSTVISNASKVTTYLDLVGEDALPEASLAQLRGRKPSVSAVTVYVGFDRSPEELGITH
ncbi:MAG: NAD(P)/FAD-dependent oxidoreductase, partial [bacterium]|nr:NAD(P)/FAD-dependent oxidoreductase [bacterium]